MKLCKDCKHFGSGLKCVNPRVVGIDIVTGENYPLDAHTCRSNLHRCGKEAEWWEPKDPPWYKVIFKRIFK